jgi:phosphohistidine phosphatase
MKTLILMRHAKSSIGEKHQDDWDRPLNKRGRKNAVAMAKLLKEKEAVPQAILASAALRVRQTAELMVEELAFHGDVHYLASLFHGEMDTYLAEVQAIPDGVECLMVIGHNPMLEAFLQVLSGKVESLPTASIAYLKVPINHWRELTLEPHAELEHFWKPKD